MSFFLAGTDGTAFAKIVEVCLVTRALLFEEDIVA